MFSQFQYEPAHTAQQIVNWYSAKPHVGLWLLLIGLPFTVLTSGALMLAGQWRQNSELRQFTRATLSSGRAHLSTLLIAAAIAAAAGILSIVALHVLTD